MEKKNSQIFNLPKQLGDEIKMFCNLNEIENIDNFIMGCLRGGFAIEKFGRVPIKAGKEIVEKETIKEVEKFVEVIKEVPVEKIIEKIIEIPVEKTIEKIVEVPVEKIVEKEIYLTDNKQVNELTDKIQSIQNQLIDKDRELQEKEIQKISLENKITNLTNLLNEKPKEIIKEVQDENKINSLQKEIKSLNDKIKEYEDVLEHFSRFSGSKATHLKSSRLNDNLYKD
jgi:hypothetical protein